MLYIHRFILVYAIIACILLYITENIYHPVYIVQMMQKVVSFLVIPLVLGWMLHRPIGRFGHITRASVLYGV